jgi:hypothetical protein
MPGIDRFLSKSLEIVIKKDLDDETEYRMKRAMFEKYGISIRQSVEDIEKLLHIRKDFLGESNDLSLKKYLKKICNVKKSKDGKSFEITILDESLKKSILEKLGDDESRRIILATVGKEHTNSEVLDSEKISTTSGYRKINVLIRDGFLIKSKSKLIETRRSVEQYLTFYDRIVFEMKKNHLILIVIVNKKTMQSSSLFPFLFI